MGQRVLGSAAGAVPRAGLVRSLTMEGGCPSASRRWFTDAGMA